MKPNPKHHNIINLSDRKAYNSILVESVAELSRVEIRLKEIALNLLSKSEYSNWNKGIQIGQIKEINDFVFETSNDIIVKGMFSLSLKVSELKEKVARDCKL